MILFQSTRVGLGGNAEDGDTAAHDDMVDHLIEGGGRAAHFEPDVEALLHA